MILSFITLFNLYNKLNMVGFLLFIGGRKSFNWLTGSSIDTLTEYTVPSSSESLSSSMLFVNKRSEKSQRGTLKPVGPNFGKKKLGLPGDEVDSTTKGIGIIVNKMFYFVFNLLYTTELAGRASLLGHSNENNLKFAAQYIWCSNYREIVD